MNKFLRFLGYIGVYILIIVEVFLLALFLTSPVMCIATGIMDSIRHVPSFLTGRYFIAWLTVSAVLWLPMFIYVIAKGKIKAIKKQKKS